MLNQSHTHTHTQNHKITTAHLAQTMSLLELTTAELRQKIESDLACNPALELVEESRCPTCHRLLHGIPSCPLCTVSNAAYPDQPIVFLSSREDFYTYNTSGNMLSDVPEDNNSPVYEDLPQYVMRQIAPELLPDDRLIAAHILTSLNED